MKKLRILIKGIGLSMKVLGPKCIISYLLGFLLSILPILQARYYANLTDELYQLATGSVSIKIPLYTFCLLVIIFLCRFIFQAIGQYFNNMKNLRVMKFTNQRLLQLKLYSKYKYIDNYDGFQKKLSFLSNYSGQEVMYSFSTLVNILQSMITLLMAAITIWTVSPYIVLGIIVTTIPAAVLSYLQQDESFRYRTKWIEEGSLAVHYYNTIGGACYNYGSLQEIRHFQLFEYLKARWRTIADEYLGKKNKIMRKHLRYNALSDLLRSGIYIAILLITAYQIYQNPLLGIGTFTLVYSLSGVIQSLTSIVFVEIMYLARSTQYMKEYFDLEQVELETKSSNESLDMKGDIQYKDVCFTYPNSEEEVLKGINITIKAGEKVAIVGDNGSGKSTFINLLTGMYEPDRGHISIDGYSLKDHLPKIRTNISVVFQDFAHYDSTLRENITISDQHRNASDEELRKLLSDIQILDVIEEQPSGLDEMIGSFSQKGNNLSGGQWQKISLARAAYRNKANIMVLDEPTAALDPKAEAQLYRNFSKLTKDKTTLLVSHRLGITSLVDRILVFHKGEIIEDGSHEELMRQGGHYVRMYQAQARWYQKEVHDEAGNKLADVL